MAVTESERYELYQVLVEKLGAEGAQTLMEHLPPAGWSEVATKHDLDHHRALTHADLDQYRADTRAQLDQHRSETSAQLAEMRNDLEVHRTEMRSMFDQHSAGNSAQLEELRGEIRESELRLEAKIERGLRLNAMTIIGVNASLLTVVVTVLALLGR
jgi:hypothetical protein